MIIKIQVIGDWGLGDLLNLDAALTRWKEVHSPTCVLKISGKLGILKNRPDYIGEFDPTVEPPDYRVLGYKQLGPDAYQKLEGMRSLRDHMGSYFGLVGGVTTQPSLYLDQETLRQGEHIRSSLQIGASEQVIFLCIDGKDRRRHPSKLWWYQTIKLLRQRLAKKSEKIILVGREDELSISDRFYLGKILKLVDGDLRGLDFRVTAAIIQSHDIHIGPNSGCFQYFQTRDCHHVVLFSMNLPERYIFQQDINKIAVVQCVELPCINCCAHAFKYIEAYGCVSKVRGECISSIHSEQVVSAALRYI